MVGVYVWWVGWGIECRVSWRRYGGSVCIDGWVGGYGSVCVCDRVICVRPHFR